MRLPGRRKRPAAQLEIEDGAAVVQQSCPDCTQTFQRVTAFVLRDGNAHAVYYASCYHHDPREAWIDVIFSPTWDEGADDRLTFGCRVGPVGGQSDPAAFLVTAAAAFGDSTLFGHKLTRDEALAHPLLTDFWAVVDHVLVHDDVVRDHVYGPGAIL